MQKQKPKAFKNKKWHITLPKEGNYRDVLKTIDNKRMIGITTDHKLNRIEIYGSNGKVTDMIDMLSNLEIEVDIIPKI